MHESSIRQLLFSSINTLKSYLHILENKIIKSYPLPLVNKGRSGRAHASTHTTQHMYTYRYVYIC